MDNESALSQSQHSSEGVRNGGIEAAATHVEQYRMLQCDGEELATEIRTLKCPQPFIPWGALTDEFKAMSPLDKWETLVLHGLIGESGPWTEDMRQALRDQEAALGSQHRSPPDGMVPDYLRKLSEAVEPELFDAAPLRIAQMLHDGAAAQRPQPDNLHSHDFKADGRFLRALLDWFQALSAAPSAPSEMKLPSREWLRNRIASDPDDAECEARPGAPSEERGA